MRSPLGAPALALALALAVLTGCGDTDRETADRAAQQDRLRPASPDSPAGTTRVYCDVASAHGRVRLSLDLPRGFRPQPPTEGEQRTDGCVWSRPVRVPDGDPGMPRTFASDVVLVVEGMARDETLRAERDDQRRFAVEGDSPAGDDSILHLLLREDVPALGPTRGGRLSYLCFCDGQDLLYRMAQADGVRLTWNADLPLQAETDRQLEAVLTSVGTTPDLSRARPPRGAPRRPRAPPPRAHPTGGP